MVIDHHDHDHDPPNEDHLKKDELFDSIELLIVIDEAHPLPVVLHLHLIIIIVIISIFLQGVFF